MRKALAALFATAALVGGAAGSASAHQSGLINVDISDVLNNNNIAVVVPISVAANICDVNVVVLAADLADDGEANCTARSGNTGTVRQAQ